VRGLANRARKGKLLAREKDRQQVRRKPKRRSSTYRMRCRRSCLGPSR
jgi:hypothetical protein